MKEFLGVAFWVILALIFERFGILATLKFIGNLIIVAIGSCIVFVVIGPIIFKDVYKILTITLIAFGVRLCWDAASNWCWRRWYQRLVAHPSDEPAPPVAAAKSTALA